MLTVIAAWAATVLLGLRDDALTPPAEMPDDRVLADDGDGWPRLACADIEREQSGGKYL